MYHVLIIRRATAKTLYINWGEPTSHESLNDLRVYHGTSEELRLYCAYGEYQLTNAHTCKNALVTDEFSENVETGNLIIVCATKIAAGYAW